MNDVIKTDGKNSMTHANILIQNAIYNKEKRINIVWNLISEREI